MTAFHETPRMSAETEQNAAGANLLALADRCEKASGPDRELERDISYALGWQHVPNEDACDDDDYGFLSDPWIWLDSTGAPQDGFPDWSSSLDAAITLVPEGMGWFKERGAYVPNIAVIQGPTCSFVGETDSSFTLALCAAALRARATLPSPVKEAE